MSGDVRLLCAAVRCCNWNAVVAGSSWLVRYVSTSYAPSKGQGSGTEARSPKVRVIPFQVSRATAVDAFLKYHSEGMFLSAQKRTVDKVKESFLPFWVAQCSAGVQVSAAEIGFERLTRQYNPLVKSYVLEKRTVWEVVHLGLVWHDQFIPESTEMQLYAGLKYMKSDVRPLHPGPWIDKATAFTHSMLDSSDGGTRRVGPFNMEPEIAKAHMKNYIEAIERNKAVEVIKGMYKCDDVRFVQMSVEMRSYLASPIYVPVYIFSNTYRGAKVRSFVSGLDPLMVSGTRSYDENKVALVVVGASWLVLLLTGQIWLMSLMGMVTYGFVLPGLLGILSTRYHPVVSSWWRGMYRWGREQYSSRQSGGTPSSAWDEEWVTAYSRHAYYEEQRQQRENERQYQYQQQQRQQQRQQASWGGFNRGKWRGQENPRDPQGYYHILGVQPGCSLEELQAAFRGLALKHHPDRYSTDEEKKVATAKFQKITEAYQVLRDDRKRRKYGQMGGGA